MRKFGLTALALALSVTISARAEDAKKPSDAEISRLLVGAWQGADPSTGATGTIRYAKDGTFTADGLVPVGKKQLEINTSGTWSVSGGTIVSTVTKSSRPRIAPVGAEVKEAVKAIDDMTIKFTRGAEAERTRTRVKE